MASAWLGEKLSQLKLRLDDLSSGTLRLLETTEAISLGVEGKRLLWRALAAAAENHPELRTCDYAHLTQRAEDQRRQLEILRVDAAKRALGETP